MNSLFEKIRHESRIFENEDFFIVKDLFPITEHHYLLFHQNEISSFSEVDITKLQSFLHQFVETKKENYYYFEAGNNTFCSTFEGNYIAHAHLIPSLLLDNFFIEISDAQIQQNVELDILNSIKKNEQYLIWGEIDKLYNLVYPILNCTKRFFRTKIQNYINNGQ